MARHLIFRSFTCSRRDKVYRRMKCNLQAAGSDRLIVPKHHFPVSIAAVSPTCAELSLTFTGTKTARHRVIIILAAPCTKLSLANSVITRKIYGLSVCAALVLRYFYSKYIHSFLLPLHTSFSFLLKCLEGCQLER
jgi:hypothetical protein